MIKNIKELFKRLLPKEAILKYRISKTLGYKINIKNPSTFNEKIQWIKLNNKNKLLSICADKVEVRKYIRDKIGKEYLIPIHNIFNSYLDIDIEKLPNSFALKAAHGSGWNIICKDKKNLDPKEFYQKIKKWGKTNYYWTGFEYAYKNIPPRFICEKLILENDGESPMDYKFFCFNGKPVYIQLDLDRYSSHSRQFYNTDWERQKINLGYKSSDRKVEKPSNLNKMLAIATELSKSFNFVRVDLYNCANKVYFGEMTFYPGEGIERFTPQKYDLIFGDQLNLNTSTHTL